MSKHSDPTVGIGDDIVGRCVTINSIHTGKVTKVVQTPGEYTTRFHIATPDGSRIVFFQGMATTSQRSSTSSAAAAAAADHPVP
jgi:hypothetical protein